MAAYFLSPPPAKATGEHSFATWNDGFTEEELKKIDEIGSSLLINESITGEGKNEIIRKSKNSWIPYNNDTAFIYDRLGWIARQLNGQFFDFDITGFFEDLQFTIYNSDESHYDWHLDRGGVTDFPPRKLSLVLQLSDPSEYEGGELQFYISSTPTVLEKKRGLVVAFPSYTLHRVTPVTSGIRKSLVVWLSGPKFR
jgi:PKHD-type hydroxylase